MKKELNGFGEEIGLESGFTGQLFGLERWEFGRRIARKYINIREKD